MDYKCITINKISRGVRHTAPKSTCLFDRSDADLHHC